jgi:hypothetical protein
MLLLPGSNPQTIANNIEELVKRGYSRLYATALIMRQVNKYRGEGDKYGALGYFPSSETDNILGRNWE